MPQVPRRGATGMLATLRSTWALLFGIALLMLGHGLQGTLLSLRATAEQFGTVVTGIVMSGYFVGLLAGSLLTPRLVARVGHVRVFAAMASLASTAVLVHALLVDPTLWFAMRFLTGLCFSAGFIVAESWLNGSASNDTRGTLFAVYMLVAVGGVAGGQLLLNLADPDGYALFMAVSVLVSLALIPILLSDGPAPPIRPYRSFGLARLYRVSPLGFVGIAGSGLSQAALYAMGPVYGREIGLGTGTISLLMAAAILGGALLQLPIGRLSDRLDRRSVILGATVLAALAALAAPFAQPGPPLPLMLLFALFGGLSLPLYSLCVAHTNDFLAADEMVGASSALLLANAIGCVAGPIAAALVMRWLGGDGLLWYLAAVHLAIGGFAVWRMTRRTAVPVAEKGPARFIAPDAADVATAVSQEARQGRPAMA